MKGRITLDSGTRVWTDNLVVNFSREDIPLDGEFFVNESLVDHLSGLSDFILEFELADCLYKLQVFSASRNEMGQIRFKMLSILCVEF